MRWCAPSTPRLPPCRRRCRQKSANLDLLIFPPTRRLLVGLREWAREQDDIRGFLYRWREAAFSCCAPAIRTCISWCALAGTPCRPARRRWATRPASAMETGGGRSMSAIPDPIAAGLARGWQQVVDASTLRADTHYEADVVIIGTGAGGGGQRRGVEPGRKVLLIEEGRCRWAGIFVCWKATPTRSCIRPARRGKPRIRPSPSCRAAQWAARPR